METNVPILPELLKKYDVRADYTTLSSNIVYPWDNNNGFTTYGKMNQEDVDAFISTIFGLIGTAYAELRIANKYAIPLFAVGSLHTLITFFVYQHDNDTYLLSKSDVGQGYFG